MHVRELDTENCLLGFEAMRELRGDLTEESFQDQVTRQFLDGYRLVGVFEHANSPAFGVAGFRFVENLAWGRHCYIDDLSTLPAARGRGAATLLLEWIADQARAAGLEQMHLDSGVQAQRHDAHRLYLAKGYNISSFHFTRLF